MPTANGGVAQPQDRLLRADLLADLGRTDEAERWYRSIEYYPESVLAGPGHLAQTRLYGDLKQLDKAIEEYRRLIDLWGEADPEFQPIVQRARERLRIHTRVAN